MAEAATEPALMADQTQPAREPRAEPRPPTEEKARPVEGGTFTLARVAAGTGGRGR